MTGDDRTSDHVDHEVRVSIESAERSAIIELQREILRVLKKQDSNFSAELAVIRAAVSRLVTAVQGDKAIGADGLVDRLARYAERIETLEASVAASVNEGKNTRKSWTLVFAVLSMIAGAASWVTQIFGVFR